MKFKKLSALALLAVVGISTAAPSLTSAAAGDSSQKSTGEVIVGSKPINPGEDGVVDPEIPEDPELPVTPGIIDPNPDPALGDKGIVGVSPLKFDDIKVGTLTANAQKINPTTGKYRGVIVAFADYSGDYKGYNVSAALTKQFTNSTDNTTLKGATLTYTNPLLATNGSAKITAAPTANGVLAESATGAGAGASVTFVKAAKGEGGGPWSLEFGQSTDKAGNTVDTTGTSVKLDIPKATANSMTKGTYTAEITWTMSATA